jgi:NitT/TauT family transport system permease protein
VRLARSARRFLLGALLPAVLLLVWHRASETQGSIVPGVGDVLDVLAHPLADPPALDSRSLAFSTLVSLVRVLTGYLAAAITAIPLGLVAGCSRWVREAVSPIVEMLRPICPVAWLPVAIIIFGFASAGSLLYGRNYWQHSLLSGVQLAMVALIWWGGFFPIFLNTVHGVLSVRHAYLEAASVLGASRTQRFFKIVVPASLPSVLTGMRVAFGICWMVIIAAEFFPGTRGGLGYMITTAHEVAHYQYAFASLVVIAFLGLGLNGLFSLLVGTVGRWQARER